MLNVEFISTCAYPRLFTKNKVGMILRLVAVPGNAAYVVVDC